LDIIDAILIAEKTLRYGSIFIDKLKGHSKETISREELEELLVLPSFDDLLEEGTGDNTTDEQ
jgi:hypothetical protein